MQTFINSLMLLCHTMILSDYSIKEAVQKKDIVITPFNLECLQPASVDLSLADSILVFKNFSMPFLDVREASDELYEKVSIAKDKPFILHPGEFVLGSTKEHIELASHLAARIEGKSSLGRLGLLIHSTAGFIDPGFKGTVTLELSNVARLPITLYADMRIGQISFTTLSTPAERPYGSQELNSKYQHQTGATASQFHKNF